MDAIFGMALDGTPTAAPAAIAQPAHLTHLHRAGSTRRLLA
jgi:hypothetical protein